MSISQEKLLDELIEIVVKEGGSDLHLSEGKSPIIRVSGFLIPLIKIPILSKEDMSGFLSTFLSPGERQEFENFKETNFAYSHKDKLVRPNGQSSGPRFRCNAFLTLGRVSVAMRLVPTEVKSFEDLNLPSNVSKVSFWLLAQ